MTVRGGTSGKIGDRYENRWFVLKMVDVMNEQADFICSEPPGVVGIDFVLGKGDALEYYQVKKPRTRRRNWTIRDLDTEDVLKDFFNSLATKNVTCVLATGTDTDLRELTEAAKATNTVREFENQLNRDQQAWFAALVRFWGCSPSDAYRFLLRITVTLYPEDQLEDDALYKLSYLIENEHNLAYSKLQEYARDNLSSKLTAWKIWGHLTTLGLTPRQYWKDPKIVFKVPECNERYVSRSAYSNKLRIITRDVADGIIDLLCDQADRNPANVLLTGVAGVGKTNVILQTIDKLREKGMPFLVFRLDDLEPTNLPNDVGNQLDLPASPAFVLRSSAKHDDCVLIIDQLDAVSIASARSPLFFHCVEQIINQAQGLPNMQILLACREFDLEFDDRLQKLKKEGDFARVFVDRLELDTVSETLIDLGFDPNQLNENQLDLLSIPLHLNLLAETIDEASTEGNKIVDFRSRTDLYEIFWRSKKQAIRLRLDRPVDSDWNEILDVLCNCMRAKQTLTVPEITLADCSEDVVHTMVSERVLVASLHHYTFFHQGFFDYVFTRRFFAHGGKVAPFLEESVQNLFKRAQIRQLLLFERDKDFEQYLKDLGQILTEKFVRPHIKQVALSVLAELTMPKPEEWVYVSDLLLDETWNMWRFLLGKVGWFDFLADQGLLKEWLAGEDLERFEQTLKFLDSVQAKRCEAVIDLLRPCLYSSKTKETALLHFVTLSDLSAGRSLFELFLQLVDEGFYDEYGKGNPTGLAFWEAIFSLRETKPTWACESISRFLMRCLRIDEQSDERNQLKHTSNILSDTLGISGDILMKCSSQAPRSFICRILPFVLRVIEVSVDKEDLPPWQDHIWERPYQAAFEVKHAILDAVGRAMRILASTKPAEFKLLVSKLQCLRFETVDFLLIRAFAASQPEATDEAVDFICNEPSRLMVGYERYPYWASRELLEAVTPHCSTGQIKRLADAINAYFSVQGGDKCANERNAYARLVLLDGITEQQRLPCVSLELKKLRLTLGIDKIVTPPPYLEDGVKPPFSDEDASMCSDEDWLQAMKHYDGRTRRFAHNGTAYGGVHELSGVLERQVQRDPDRFAKLTLSLTSAFHDDYFKAILRGLEESDADPNLVMDACSHCHQMPGKPYGSEIVWTLSCHADQALPLEALEILRYYALEGSGESSVLWRDKDPGDPAYYDDLFTAGFNSVRGRAAIAIANTILRDISAFERFCVDLKQNEDDLTIFDLMVEDPSVAVKSCTCATVKSIVSYNEQMAIELFLRLINADKDDLLGTPLVEDFMIHALRTGKNIQQLDPVIASMVASNLPLVSTIGARLACSVQAYIKPNYALASSCLSGTAAQRIGAAEAFAAELGHVTYRHVCEKALKDLFNDSDQRVRDKASTCFFHVGDDDLVNYEGLVESFIESDAFEKNAYILFRALEKRTSLPTRTTINLCNKLLDLAGSKLTEHRRIARVDLGTVTEFALRGYNQSEDDEQLQLQYLDIIDRLVIVGAHKMDMQLALHDR